MMRYVLLIVATGGCYFQTGIGATAPTKHGYGSVAPTFALGLGAERTRSWGRIGGGLATGFRSGYAVGGVEMRSDIVLHRSSGDLREIVLATSVAGVSGQSVIDDDQHRAVLLESFVGIGAGARAYDDSSIVRNGHIALGVVASRIWPNEIDGAWFVGIAVDLQAGFDLDRLMDKLGSTK